MEPAIAAPRRSAQAIVPFLLLALPFVAGVIALDGLRSGIITFHGTDEFKFHYPVIRKFLADFPAVDLRDYRSATTPLFHLLMAAAGKIFGADVPTLRAVNVLIGYATSICMSCSRGNWPWTAPGPCFPPWRSACRPTCSERRS